MFTVSAFERYALALRDGRTQCFSRRSVRDGLRSMAFRSMIFLFVLFAFLGLTPITPAWGAPIPGDFDTAPFPGFAAGLGKVEGISIGAAGVDVANAMVLQPDGKIVLAGSCWKNASGLSDFCLARLDADGILDRSFSGPSGSGSGSFILPFSLQDSKASALTLQPDGKIVVAGFCADGITTSTSAFYDELFCLARLNGDGSLDLGFGGSGDGQVILRMGVAAVHGFAVLVQPDGKIVMGGHCFDGVDDAFCFARLNDDGSLDLTFNGPGNAGLGKVLVPIGFRGFDRSFALLLQPDGKIVAASNAETGFNSGSLTFNFHLVRLTTTGRLDKSFIGPGVYGHGHSSVAIGTSYSYATSLALQSDGKIVVGGYCHDAGTNNKTFCVARLNEYGRLDTSFNGPSGSAGGKFLLPMGFIGERAQAIALQDDEKILLTGSCFGGLNTDFCMARLLQDGRLDKSFDGPSGTSDGTVVLPMGSKVAYSRALTVQPDGKILVAGGCVDQVGHLAFCIARLHGGP